MTPPKNISYDFKSLKRQGLRIWSKRKLSNFVFQYGQTRVLIGYAACLIAQNGNFLPKSTSGQLMKLVNFDHRLGVKILKQLFDFEQRLNSVMITTILAKYKLPQNYILDLDNCSWLTFKNPEDKENFKRNMYQNVDTCNFLRYYEDKTKVPLMSLSLAWTFYNTLAFFEATPLEIKQEVIRSLGLKHWDVNSFRNIGHIIRKIRNTISHNDCVLISKYEGAPELLEALEIDPKRKFIFIYDLCNFLDQISSSKKSLVKTITKVINSAGFKKIIRNRIGKLLGWDLKSIRAVIHD